MNHPLKLIVGLGNPGPQYAHTRHNAGEDFVESLARHCHCTLSQESKFFGRAGEASIAGQRVRLLIPNTFMNRSGQSISALAGFFKIAPENILIAYDELDICLLYTSDAADE